MRDEKINDTKRKNNQRFARCTRTFNKKIRRTKIVVQFSLTPFRFLFDKYIFHNFSLVPCFEKYLFFSENCLVTVILNMSSKGIDLELFGRLAKLPEDVIYIILDYIPKYIQKQLLQFVAIRKVVVSCYISNVEISDNDYSPFDLEESPLDLIPLKNLLLDPVRLTNIL